MDTENTVIDGVEVPTSAAADWTIRAAAAGISLGVFVGILALGGAYGPANPRVTEAQRRAAEGDRGPKYPKV